MHKASHTVRPLAGGVVLGWECYLAVIHTVTELPRWSPFPADSSRLMHTGDGGGCTVPRSPPPRGPGAPYCEAEPGVQEL